MFIALVGIALLVVLTLEFFYLRNLIGRFLSFWGFDTSAKKVKIAKYLIMAVFMITTVPIFTVVGMLSLHIFVLATFIDLCCLIVRLITRKRWGWLRFVSSSLVLPVVIGVGAVIYGYINMHTVVKTEYEIETEKSLTQDYEIAFISDVHMSISLDLEEIKEVANEISSQKPHLLLLGGDIVDESTPLNDMKELFKIFGQVDTVYGTYFVYGNHDDLGFSGSRGNYTDADLREAINDAGITLLEDDVVNIGTDLTLIGRLDASYKGKDKERRQSIDSLLKDVDKERFILVLDHQPVEYDEKAQAGVDLSVSGHTHAGQIWPLGVFTTIVANNEDSYGLTKSGPFHAIVSSGIAGWGFPIKTAESAEYLMITVCGK